MAQLVQRGHARLREGVQGQFHLLLQRPLHPPSEHLSQDGIRAVEHQLQQRTHRPLHERPLQTALHRGLGRH